MPTTLPFETFMRASVPRNVGEVENRRRGKGPSPVAPPTAEDPLAREGEGQGGEVPGPVPDRHRLPAADLDDLRVGQGESGETPARDRREGPAGRLGEGG